MGEPYANMQLRCMSGILSPALYAPTTPVPGFTYQNQAQVLLDTFMSWLSRSSPKAMAATPHHTPYFSSAPSLSVHRVQIHYFHRGRLVKRKGCKSSQATFVVFM